jgi:hypothetical protein
MLNFPAIDPQGHNTHYPQSLKPIFLLWSFFFLVFFCRGSACHRCGGIQAVCADPVQLGRRPRTIRDTHTLYKRSELIPMSFRDQCEQPHVAAKGVRCMDWIFSVGFQQKHEPNIERMV